MDFQEDNPKNLPFLPSPSSCSAEIFWPDSLKTIRQFVQQNPYRKSQNYIETLLASRNEQFPLEVRDSSLEFYLGFKGGSDLPTLPGGYALEMGRDGSVCAGAPVGAGSQKCQGLQMEWQDGDASLPLEGLELLSAQDLEVQGLGALGLLPGVQASGVTVRGGRLLLGVKLGNPFWNATLPLAFPLPGVKMSPNPYDPTQYDLDLTDMLLKQLPVAYDVKARTSVSYEDYQAATDKSGLRALPYFLNIARAGKLPSRLSLNEVYHAVMELRANTDRSSKPRDPAQLAILGSLLDNLSVHTKLHPSRLLGKNLFVEFEQDSESNLFQTSFAIKQLKDWEVTASAPVRVNRLFSPGLIDVTRLQADLGLHLHHSEESALDLDNLEFELGRLEYLQTDQEKPGLFAILGGEIRGIPDILNNYLIHQPAIRIRGTADAIELGLNFRLEGVKLRLPVLGEVTINGELSGGIKLVPKFESVLQENGEYAEVKRWVVKPHSVHLKLSDVDLRAQSGLHWEKANLEISDASPWGDHGFDTHGALVFRFTAPQIEGGYFRSFTIEGGLPLIKDKEGHYDLRATLRDVNTDFILSAVKHNGIHENWRMDLQGDHRAEASHLIANLKGIQTDDAGKVLRTPIQGMKVDFSRRLLPDGSSFGLHFGAERIDFDRLDLKNPRFDFVLNREETSPGVTRWSVPQFEFRANDSGWTKKGLVRGPIWLVSKAGPKAPFQIEIDRNGKDLSLSNLNLQFGVTGLTHPNLSRQTGGRIIGLDVDGRLRGHWKMNYETFKGKGLISLSGDGQGDIHLRGADGMPLSKPHPDDDTLLVGTPVLSNTQWSVRKVDGIDRDNQWVNGHFHLSTLIDPAVARVFGVIFDNNLVLSWSFNHDHLPYTPAGFTRKIEEYLARKDWQESKAPKKTEVPSP